MRSSILHVGTYGMALNLLWKLIMFFLFFSVFNRICIRASVNTYIFHIMLYMQFMLYMNLIISKTDLIHTKYHLKSGTERCFDNRTSSKMLLQKESKKKEIKMAKHNFSINNNNNWKLVRCGLELQSPPVKTEHERRLGFFPALNKW